MQLKSYLKSFYINVYEIPGLGFFFLCFFILWLNTMSPLLCAGADLTPGFDES